MPWMAHIFGNSPRIRAHYFNSTLDDIPICGNISLNTDQYTPNDTKQKCTKCQKIIEKDE